LVRPSPAIKTCPLLVLLAETIAPPQVRYRGPPKNFEACLIWT
jgi:hypothetical protein